MDVSTKLCNLNLCTTITNIKSLSGGSISNAACYSTDKGDYFVKTNTSKQAFQWFNAEYLALKLFQKSHIPNFTPKPIHHGKNFIVTEYIPMSQNTHSQVVQNQFGQSLATLHSTIISTQGSGFDVPSFCGTTELFNSWNSDWSLFWRKQRLEPLFNQVKGQNQDMDKLGQELCSRIDHWLGPDVLSTITPCLLHGDLWSGNWAVRKDTQTPFIFDPASYYGHYEAEFGIMNMFGGFTKDFLESYQDTLIQHDVHKVQEEGQGRRLLLYELYHHLNHYAMFGGGYGSSCIHIMEKLL